jgi:hypothetical protein
MGGRGGSAGAGYRIGPIDTDKLGYNAISYNTPLGGATYPFLEQTGRAWHVLTRPLEEADEYHPVHTFGMDSPTLRWVSGNSIADVYIDNMTSEQFLEATGLELSLDKGAFVLSKRLSRVMRPHLVSGFFEPNEAQIVYLELDKGGMKVWDGAGLVSRKMLQKMILSEELSPTKRARLEQELNHTRRVEFTIMTAAGQDKGHAIVVDDLEADFVLPQDTKREIRLGNGQTFVGISFVHGHDDMRLDIQSLINLQPFFEEEQLLGWLKDEGDLFLQSVETGSIADMMTRIDQHTTIEDVTSWHVREYLVSGGHPMWFGGIVKSLVNQHLRRLNHATLEKLRLPIPGGRYYVMPAGIGRQGGLRLTVPRGHIHIDHQRGTAWVNDEDWLSLPDSPGRAGSPGEGIAGILGGADNDDALWVFPFEDHDGQHKVLAWRSPNQVGEYVLLKPTADSHVIEWSTTDDAVRFPQANSRKLPPRVDFTDPDYLGLVDPEATSGLGAGEAYTVDVMDWAAERALANQGALGMYCNSLMVNKAIYDRLPDKPPAPLEEIIDSSVKTGADLSQVIIWNYQNSRQILESGVPIPEILHGRLSYDREDRPPWPVASQKHWLDKTVNGVKAHIAYMEARRDALVQATRPPQDVFDSVANDPEAVRIGSGLNQVYIGTIRRLARDRPYQIPVPEDFGSARHAAEEYLAKYPPPHHPAIIRGAIASVYAEDIPASDAAVWVPGMKDSGSLGIAQRSLDALRDIGIIDEIDKVPEGLIVYPNASAFIPSDIAVPTGKE